MTTRPPSPRAGTVLVSGLATAAYYATPDVIASRTARAWAKTGIVAVSLVAAAPELRAAWAAARRRPEVDGEPLPSIDVRSLPAGKKAVLLGSATAALVLAVRGAVAAERSVFRRGERRAAAGKRLPHTGPALLYGALTTALWWLPAPAEEG
ncbi:hypothetical protein [Modestobacter versicolor]|uniref:Peptidase S9 n=1 Tax=Modestobacter versicolor TaxID=429133 RepID=A0A323V4B1_9ACTN|nr:hypothetical protein [Modestobacter versicolor]MBB3675168.1 hypothetical protein [Modestobacter versicolor]PZA19659.1 hypothetical protein DMO24_19550 [Modestobacter versicolor]